MSILPLEFLQVLKTYRQSLQWWLTMWLESEKSKCFFSKKLLHLLRVDKAVIGHLLFCTFSHLSLNSLNSLLIITLGSGNNSMDKSNADLSCSHCSSILSNDEHKILSITPLSSANKLEKFSSFLEHFRQHNISVILCEVTFSFWST